MKSAVHESQRTSRYVMLPNCQRRMASDRAEGGPADFATEPRPSRNE